MLRSLNYYILVKLQSAVTVKEFSQSFVWPHSQVTIKITSLFKQRYGPVLNRNKR